MLTQLWQSYKDGNYDECLRFAAETTAKHHGINLLAAAGGSLIRLRRVEEGLYMLKAAAAFRPDQAAVYHFACSLADEYVLVDALDYFAEMGLRDFPQDASLLRYQAATKFLRMDPAALGFYEAIVRDNPADLHAHLNLATMYRNRAELAQAEQHYVAVDQIDPNNVNAAIGRAAIHLNFGRTDEARALLEPLSDNPDVRFLLATIALACGDYPTGWALYRSRWDTTMGKQFTKPPRPCDDLADLVGKRVAVLREGGHGDLIQLVRYIPLLAAQASTVRMLVDPSELRLLQANMPENVRIRATPEMPKEAYTIAPFDLPYLFRTTIETIPPAPYLTVPAEAVRERCLLPTTKKRVGVCWAGGAQINVHEGTKDRGRSIRLSQLASLREFADRIEFISLQAGARANDPGLVTTRLLGDDFDWLDTAAIIQQLDLVITVDTGIVHLAGALGRPTWLLACRNSCWRWFGNRADSLWYPGIVRVFGQPGDDWAPVVETVHAALADWLA